MAKELEALIEDALLMLSCAGEQGYNIAGFSHYIQNYATEIPIGEDRTTLQFGAHDAQSISQQGSQLWMWLVSRTDVSVGSNRKFNHLSIQDALRLHHQGTETTADSKSDIMQPSEEAICASTSNVFIPRNHKPDPLDICISVSEQRMWESLTGHGPDQKRVPRSEWDLLLGIASMAEAGILQGDLGRLVGQDKRSVPKRTDSLVGKGYIVKHSTLVRGTKTSKLWLKPFAPQMTQTQHPNTENAAEMILSRHLLVGSLEPVPWHVRWTRESIDYPALVTTIMALCREWGVLRLHDLKSKLGILGMRWQMKVVAKLCRFLNARGAIRYVAAKLDNQVFKDCIGFHRSLTARDWSMYKATGKRMTQVGVQIAKSDNTPRHNEQLEPSRIQKYFSCAVWDVDMPLLVAIERILRSFGPSGSGNLDVCFLSIGPLFTRFISAVTSTISADQMQPQYLDHLAVLCEHRRFGKIASFQYFLKYPVINATMLAVVSSSLRKWPNEGALEPSALPLSPNSTYAQIIGVDISKTSTQTPQSAPALNTEAERTTSQKTIESSASKSNATIKRKTKHKKRSTNEQHRWMCDKCGGSWKNDIGLKYHLEKSNTPCNPNVKPQSATKLKQLEGQFAVTTNRTGNSDGALRQYLCRGALYSNWIKRTKQAENPLLPADSSTRLVAQVLDIHVPLSSSIAELKDEGNLLVDHSRKRLVDTIKAKEQAPQLDTDQMILQLRQSTNINDAPQHPLSSAVVATNHGSDSTGLGYKEVAAVEEPVGATIQSLLGQFGGALPGLPSLATLIAQNWSIRFPVEQPPETRKIEAAVKRLLLKNIIIDHWHGFRTHTGKFDKIQILMRPGSSISSPTAVAWIERLKLAYPSALQEFDVFLTNAESDKEAKPNRRLLSSEIAVLDAPVYAAQSSAKRIREESDRAPKRPKQDRVSNISNLQPQASFSKVMIDIPQRCSDGGVETGHLDEDRLQSLLRSLPDSGSINGVVFDSGWVRLPVIGNSHVVLEKRYLPSRHAHQTDQDWAFQFFNKCSRQEQANTEPSPTSHAKSHRIFLNFCAGTNPVTQMHQTISWTAPVGLDLTPLDFVSSHTDSRNGATPSRLPLLSDIGEREETPATLISRRLTSLAFVQQQKLKIDEDAKSLSNLQYKVLMAGFIAVRTLLGGVDKLLDWGLLLRIFPTYSLVQLRSFWASVKKENWSLATKYSEDFQRAYIECIQRNELQLPDFEHPEKHDWPRMVDWTTELLFDETIDLPATRLALENKMDLYHSPASTEDWRERFFHPQSSIFSRLDSATADCGTIPVLQHEIATTGREISLSRSWIRALCATSGAKYSRQAMKIRLDEIPITGLNKATSLNIAIEQLTKEKVICKTKRGTIPSPPYRLNESYITLLSKLGQGKKFDEAAKFKNVLDESFQRDGGYTIPYSLSDGGIIALMNLHASGKVKLEGANIPFIPLGFEPGNYESRKYSKSSFNFDLRVEPTAAYLINQKIDTIKALMMEKIPLQDSLGHLPQWTDLFQTLNKEKWVEILRAVCFMLATRGWMTASGLREAMSPVLEHFEIKLIVEWGKQTGLLVVEDDLNFTVNEWWWLIAM
ncbi:hypothetical protein VHEMI10068 [[Torrubiella] hemipterigena]|uniref:Uncharacterized protein n=1 Tax=[Torrubiella] hemipterigena TaxID=1531966 RepID=A0A0A1TR71_9HYPO|nr:hypothetical protein VHEMI10068 [[Torrubiella] hemipterigena]